MSAWPTITSTLYAECYIDQFFSVTVLLPHPLTFKNSFHNTLFFPEALVVWQDGAKL